MESMLIWGVTLLIVVAVLTPYVLKTRRLQKKDRRRKREARRLGADKAIAQHPHIDALLCIGCGSCVQACPEGGVLGIVDGRATIINGLKCVGHGLCAEACPVGAIQVGLGDIKQRDDVPILDEHYQSNVPGLYIVGELSGISLIKNAITHGRIAMEHIVEQFATRPHVDGILDVVIVGAGPAGTSAALVATQAKLNYLILDAQDLGGTILQYPRKKLVMTEPVEIPLYGKLKQREIEKEALLAIWQQIYRDFNLRLHRSERVVDIQKSGNFFTVKTSAAEYLAQFVVLPMGRRGNPRKLKVPGEQQSKVMYNLIDAQSHTNSHILVVGGGDSAVEAAIGLSRQKGNTVTISYRKDRFFRIKERNRERIENQIKKKKIIPLFNSHVKEIKPASVILEQNGKMLEIQNDYVFIFIGGEAPLGFLRKIGIKFGVDLRTANATPVGH